MVKQLALTEKEILEETHRRQIPLFSDRHFKRNSFLPIFRLPPEILAIIFIHGARDCYESDTLGVGFTPSTPTWVNASYVCRYWRDVALNCPTLGTYHFAKSPHWTKELLLRSKNASLKISCIQSYNHVSDIGSWWSSILGSLLNHSERIQELRLDLSPSLLPHKLTLRAPRLEKLDLSGISIQHFAITEWDTFPLHTLKLIHCSLPWYSFNLSGLQTLFLRRVDPTPPLNMVEVLTALDRLQNLTVLHLNCVLPSAHHFLSSGGLDVSRKINLPRLALLVVIEPLPTVVALISCINIPPRTQLRLEPLLERGSTIGDFVPIRSFLARHFSQQSAGPIFRSLHFHATYIFMLTFSLEHEPQFKEVDHNIPLHITLEEADEEGAEITEWGIHRIIGDICSSLPLRNIQNLHVCWPNSFANWREILECLPGLRRMKLSIGNMPDLSLLSLPAPRTQENPIPEQDRHMFVPALEELELYRITFAPDHTSSEGGMSQKSLLEALSTRKGLRDRVTMTKCGFKQEG